MSGLLALLDDVAAIAKLAATQLDDVVAQASKAGAKAVGVVIDDAAVTPKYVAGLPASRELPIVWRIARASVLNKLIILLPVALLLSEFLPWVLTPLLMLGGCFLCYEGAEKIWHALLHKKHHHGPEPDQPIDAAHLEEQRVKGAIKTDFILSAEIMTITLSAIDADSVTMRAGVLAVVAIGITALVYGAVAALVKMDDLGLKLSQIGATQWLRNIGMGIVKAMPTVMLIISTVGTAAMLWVGGSILVHGVKDLGWPVAYDEIHHAADLVSGAIAVAPGFVNWFIVALADGIIGLIAGTLLIPILNSVLVPAVAATGLIGKPKKEQSH